MNLTLTALKIVKAARDTSRYVSACGGTRSGKTWGVLQYIVTLGIQPQPSSILWSIVSETYPHLRRGAIRDFQTLLTQEGVWQPSAWNKTESTYKFPNGMVVEFFSADNAGKVHGAARDYLFINEAQNIPYEIARQLFVRTRKKIILDYNPTRSFWVNEKVEADERCIRTHSTYLDNTFLTREQVEEIESNKADSNWWRVYGEGKIGEVEGLIFPEFDLCNVSEIPTDLPRVVGVDFGFTNAPSACVLVTVDTRKKELWLHEFCYATGMLNAEIAAALQQYKGLRVIADCAEPKTIAELKQYGLRVFPADKAKAKKTEQLQWLRGWRMKVTRESVNLIDELRQYEWRKEDGKYINEPMDEHDHAIDALRYAAYTEYGGARVKARYAYI